jgi:predicted SnoaL-like aldol condensation-catalyzing enzyme
MTNMTRAGAMGVLGLATLAAATPVAGTKTVQTLVDTFIDIVNTRAFDRFSEIMGPIYTQHHAGIGDGVQAVTAFFKMSPADLKLELVKTIVEGNYVAVISRATGTYNGKKFDNVGVDAFRIENGKFVEHWDNG